MATEVKTEAIELNGQSALLVSVKNGSNAIGTCLAGNTGKEGNAGSITRLFFLGNEPVLSIVCPNHGKETSDKLVSVSPGFQGYDRDLNSALTNGFNKLNEGESTGAALKDIFTLLEDGVYVVYCSDYYPTDGNGSFFWGAYNISHEIRGTAEHNRTIGEKPYKPCFLLPTQSMAYYATRIKASTDDNVKYRKIQGIAYHISGLYSALLKGHHGAASCVEKGLPFTCAVIEKITRPYIETQHMTQPTEPVHSEPDLEAPEAAEQIDAAGSEETAQTVFEPVANSVVHVNGADGFRSPSMKIPMSAFPKDMLRQLIEGRTEYKPKQFNTLVSKLQTVRAKTVNNNALPYAVLENAEQMPDCEMVESLYAIDDLTDEQLNCLLRGDVECNGKVIISPNFYSSIVTACGFLQFKSTRRFVDFSIAIMENPELAAVHEYVARRVSSLSDNQKVYNFFKNVSGSGDAKYEKILPIAELFVRRFK